MLRKTASFLLLPITMISGIVAFRWYDKYRHGETEAQYSARKEVEGLCDRVEAFSKVSGDRRAFTPEERATLDACTKHCETAKTSYRRMIEVMQTRRQLQIGDQKEHGLLQIGEHRDFYDDYGNDWGACYYLYPLASRGVKQDIEQELKTGFRNH